MFLLLFLLHTQGSHSLLWAATSPYEPYAFPTKKSWAREKSSFIAITSHLPVSRVASGFSQAPGTRRCLSPAACTGRPRAGWGHPHQHPTPGLDRAPGSCCAIPSGCTAACCHCCWSSYLFPSWKRIFKKNRGGCPPSHFHKRHRVRWDEGKRDVRSLSPNEQRPATNLPLFSSRVWPSLAMSTQQLFPACCEKQVSHLSLQLVVSTSLI